MRNPRLLTGLVLGTLLIGGAGCTTSQPDQRSGAAQAVLADQDQDQDQDSRPTLDLRTPANTGDVNGVTVVTPEPATSNLPDTVAPSTPPSSAATAAPTVPSTRPPVSAPSTTSAPPPSTTEAPPTTPATPSTTAATPSTAGPSSTGGPGQPQVQLVEFRIPAGTGNGPWNRVDDPVRVTVGQVLRIHNDDSVAHTIHANGAPFEHGPSIPPGGYADHPIVAPLTPDPASPSNYDHDAGRGAAFWVVSTEASVGSNGPTPPTRTGDGQGALDEAEAVSLQLLNELRTGLGLQPVQPVDAEMHTFARAWALEMRQTGFRHSSPPRWFENIVWYSDETMTPSEAAAQFHEMWVGSPGHYRNMTNPDWSVVGVGMWHDETGWWGVHVFR